MGISILWQSQKVIKEFLEVPVSEINNNYMKIIKLAIRSILNFRMYSGVNLLGLTLSLVCVITIFRYVYGEFTIDKFNKNLDRVYVTTAERSTSPGEALFEGIWNANREISFVDMTEHPGIEKYSHFNLYDNEDEVVELDNIKYHAAILETDSNFLKITDYPVISGIANLSAPNSALITQSFAHKLYGNQNPVGQTFKHSTGEILTITGIIGQIPTKSTLSFDIIASNRLKRTSIKMPQTYILLYPGIDYKTINEQYETFFASSFRQGEIRYQLFPLSKVYFDKHIINYFFKQGNFNYVKALIAFGILILLAGVFSYINIYTVVILRRGRELGVKKVFGAERHNIFLQFSVENLIMTGIALIVALIIAQISKPFIINVLPFDQASNIRFNIYLSSVILLCIPLLATLYPFFRYHYTTVINSMRDFDRIRSTGSLRRIFMSLQYVITIVFIVVSLFFIKQLQYMMNTDLGYQTKNIIKVKSHSPPNVIYSRNEEGKLVRIDDEIMRSVKASPLFTYCTYGISPNKFVKNERLFKLPDDEYKSVQLIGTDESWFRLFDIRLTAGRLWDDQTESSQDFFLIVTESLLKLYGITDFNSVLLQPERYINFDARLENPPYRIVGVVKDFDYLHLSQKSAPVAFYYFRGNSSNPLVASVVPGKTQEAIAFFHNLNDKAISGEFSYSFVEDEINEMYREDKKIATVSTIFTFIAIFISALGLLSMSLFDVRQRRKEIAIRKVNGATVADIIRLLLKKYFWSLIISFVIAAPVALLAINRYLEDFAHKAPVSWWLFAVAVGLTAGISLLTLIYQTQKAANQNPAEVVKSE